MRNANSSSEPPTWYQGPVLSQITVQVVAGQGGWIPKWNVARRRKKGLKQIIEQEVMEKSELGIWALLKPRSVRRSVFDQPFAVSDRLVV